MKTQQIRIPRRLPQSLREQMVDLLNQQLADAIDLELQSKHTLWNARSPQSLSLYVLCDRIAVEVGQIVGQIAGHIGLLGGLALGVRRAVLDTSRLPEYPLGLSSCDEYMGSLAIALESFVGSMAEAARTARENKDFESSDVLDHGCRTAEKLLSVVKSYRQKQWRGMAEAENHLSALVQEGAAA